jgi:hypothetical protein
MTAAPNAENVADRVRGILGPPGIPVERLLRLLRTITSGVEDANVRYGLSDGVFSTNLDMEDLATLMRIVSGEKWEGYCAHIDGDGGGADE